MFLRDYLLACEISTVLSTLTLKLKDDMSSLIWTYGENHYFVIYIFPFLFLLKRKTPFHFIQKIVIDKIMIFEIK